MVTAINTLFFRISHHRSFGGCRSCGVLRILINIKIDNIIINRRWLRGQLRETVGVKGGLFIAGRVWENLVIPHHGWLTI